MYTHKNFRTKKALKEAVAAHIDLGAPGVTFFQPGNHSAPTEGTIYLEGPHYPEAHSWYAKCVARNGVIIKVS